MSRTKSSKRVLASIVLSFESFVVFFATLTAFGLKNAAPDSNLPPVQWIWAIGLTLALVCIITPAFLGNPLGYTIGWVVQVAVFGSGFWLWGMFFIGAIMAGLWIWAIVAGSTIDRARENLRKMQGE